MVRLCPATWILIWIPGQYTGNCLEGAGYGVVPMIRSPSRQCCRRRPCRWLADRSSLTLLDGRDITGEITHPGVTALASMVSSHSAVREWLLPVQRKIGAEGCVVAEGRDIGTKVFPQADVKFFWKPMPKFARPDGISELVAAGHSVQFDLTKRDLTGRDDRDRSRAVAPLMPAPDAGTHRYLRVCRVDAVVALYDGSGWCAIVSSAPYGLL